MSLIHLWDFYIERAHEILSPITKVKLIGGLGTIFFTSESPLYI
jgi:hypothetical protein